MPLVQNAREMEELHIQQWTTIKANEREREINMPTKSKHVDTEGLILLILKITSLVISRGTRLINVYIY